MQIPVRIPLLAVKDFFKKYALKWNGRLQMCITGLAIIYGRQVVYIYLQELTEYSNQAEFFFRFPVMLILPFLKNFSMPLSFWMGIERLLLRGRKGSIKGRTVGSFGILTESSPTWVREKNTQNKHRYREERRISSL